MGDNHSAVRQFFGMEVYSLRFFTNKYRYIYTYMQVFVQIFVLNTSLARYNLMFKHNLEMITKPRQWALQAFSASLFMKRG